MKTEVLKQENMAHVDPFNPIFIAEANNHSVPQDALMMQMMARQLQNLFIRKSA